MVAELNCNSLENIHSWMVVLHCKAYCKAILLEKFRSYQLIRKNPETFPPQMICNIQYNLRN